MTTPRELTFVEKLDEILRQEAQIIVEADSLSEKIKQAPHGSSLAGIASEAMIFTGRKPA